MQINLLPKKKEKEKQRKSLNFLVIFISMLILAGTAGLVFLIVGANLVKKASISSLNKEISETKERIKDYSKLEKNVNSIVFGLDSAKQILDNRKNWLNLLTEIEALMPKETFLTEFSTSGNEITFKTKTISVEKVAEFIESLRNYELAVSFSDKVSEADKAEETGKVKLFNEVEISNYSKETKGGITYYMFDVKANFTEDIWKKS